MFTSSYRDVSAIVIVATGLYFHVNQISAYEMYFKPKKILLPHFTSVMFLLSGLSLACSFRPTWRHIESWTTKVGIFLAELLGVFVANDLILRLCWLPILKLINWVCQNHAQGIAKLMIFAPTMQAWLRDDMFFIARFLFVSGTLIFVAKITGFFVFLRNRYLNSLHEVYRPDWTAEEEALFDELNSRWNGGAH